MTDLPHPDEPVEITIKNGKRFIQLPSKSEAEQLVHQVRRRLADLPDIPDRTNPIAAIISYELFGLSQNEIAIATRLSISQINTIMNTEAYSQMKASIIETVKSTVTDQVTETFKNSAKSAAQKITDLVAAPSGTVALRASKHVLDYAGYTPKSKDPSEKMRDGLSIVIVSAGDTTINMPMESE
jgi:hypothetical protein